MAPESENTTVTALKPSIPQCSEKLASLLAHTTQVTSGDCCSTTQRRCVDFNSLSHRRAAHLWITLSTSPSFLSCLSNYQHWCPTPESPASILWLGLQELAGGAGNCCQREKEPLAPSIEYRRNKAQQGLRLISPCLAEVLAQTLALMRMNRELCHITLAQISLQPTTCCRDLASPYLCKAGCSFSCCSVSLAGITGTNIQFNELVK